MIDAVTASTAFAATWEHLVAGLPDGWSRRAPGAIAAVTGVEVQTLNGVWVHDQHARADDVLALLDAVAETRLPHCLELCPGADPALRDLARARDLILETEIPLMVFDQGLEMPVPGDTELSIELLDPANASVHAELAAAGFEVPLEAFIGLTTPMMLASAGVRTYIGAVDREPVATGISARIEDSVGIFNVATLPAHRRRGYGAAITARAVQDGLDDGAHWAWLQSSAAGYRIYEGLGFRTIESWECWITQ